jgi:hypothetical protein
VGFRDEAAPSRDNCIDLGSIGQAEISAGAPAAPLGYSESDDGAPAEYVIEKRIYITNNSDLANVTLLEAEFLPNVKSGPAFSLHADDYAAAEGTRLAVDGLTFLRVRINIGPKFYCAYLGKWLLLCFQGDQPRTRATEITTVQFVMAVKLTGCCVAGAGSKLTKAPLSSESRPFIPRSMLNYFDDSVRVLWCNPLFLFGLHFFISGRHFPYGLQHVAPTVFSPGRHECCCNDASARAYSAEIP